MYVCNFLFEKNITQIFKNGMPCVYYLLRSVARLVIFELHFLRTCFYNKKKNFFNTVLTLNAFFYITDHTALIMQCFLKVTSQKNKNINFKIG